MTETQEERSRLQRVWQEEARLRRELRARLAELDATPPGDVSAEKGDVRARVLAVARELAELGETQ